MLQAKENSNLALFGGPQVSSNTFTAWPLFDSEHEEAVVEVLRSGKVNQWGGTRVKQFEEEFAAFVGAKYAVAVANGTLALELALKVIGVGPGDEVIVPSRTFIASASCVAVLGAVPKICDVNLESGNLTVETVKPLVSDNTKAIIAVHMAGWPCEMDELMAFAEANDIFVIEDCAQAHGAVFKGQPVGSLGHLAAFSFCQDKIFTTGGEGGMLVLHDEDQWRAAWSYKDHGKSYRTVFEQEHPPGFRWLHESWGTNWRMTEMQAALGLVGLSRLPSYVDTRINHASKLIKALKQFSCIRVPEAAAHIVNSYYKFYCFVEADRLADGWDRDMVMNAISAEGVPCFSGSCSEIYKEKAFESVEWGPGKDLSNARKLTDSALCFLVHPTLTDEEIALCSQAIEKVLNVASQ